MHWTDWDNSTQVDNLATRAGVSNQGWPTSSISYLFKMYILQQFDDYMYV